MADTEIDAKEMRAFCSDPDRIAMGLLQSDFVYDPGGEDLKGGAFTLAWWRDDFYVWQQGCWTKKADSETKRMVTQHLQHLNERVLEPDQEIRITTQKVSNVLLCLSSKVRIPETRELNTWLDGREQLYHTVPVKNGFLMIRNNGSEPISLEPHTPKYFTLNRLPYDYDPEAKCPEWLKFLDEVMKGNQEYITLLQQWAGYLFRPDLREQKFMLCVGEGANGKGVFFDVLQALVGEQNCSHVSLSQFSRPFAAIATVGKVLNATNEASHLIESEAENTLKTLVSGDRTEFARKFKEDLQAKPTAKIIIATNSLPRFTDKTQGVWRRILLVPFDKVIPDDAQVKDLAKRLKRELPGILNWGLQGLFDLNTGAGFDIPKAHKEIIEEYRRDADPTRAFLLENYNFSRNGESLSCSTVFSDYAQWCKDNNCRATNNRNFGRQVKRMFPNVKRIRPGTRTSREWIYEGLVSYENEVCWDTGENEKPPAQDEIPF